MSIWKIASRWSDDGNRGSSILDLFRNYKIAFAYGDEIKNKVKKGDIIAISDGLKIVAVAKAIQDGCKVTDIKNIAEEDKKRFEYSDNVSTVRLNIYNLALDEYIECIRGRFHSVNQNGKKITEYYEKYHTEKKVMTFYDDIINSDYQIKIPSYQRAYAWGETQIKQFLNDLIEIKGKEYYYGHFILEDNEKDKIFEVVDGQQRITTYVLFLLAVKLYLNYKVTKEQKNFIQKKFKTISYDSDRFVELVKNIFDKNKLIETSNEDTSSIKHICKAIETFKTIFDEKKDLEINKLIETLHNAAISIHTTRDKKIAVQIFELQNSRGINLDLIEKVKAKLMKEIYLYSDESSWDKNIEQIQNNFSEIYHWEQKINESNFRGELKLDNILFHHLRVIDDNSKKLAPSFHSPAYANIEEGILEYINKKLDEKTVYQEKVDYIIKLTEYFKKSVQFVCCDLKELDENNPLVGDCLILDRNNSLECFLLLLHNNRFQELDLNLKKWELLLFTRDFHSKYYNKKGLRDDFQLLYDRILNTKEEIKSILDDFIENGFRGNKDGYKLQEEAFKKDVIEKGKHSILTNGFNYWKEKMTYVLYKYEIEEKESPEKLRKGIREHFKIGRSIEHILPQGWDDNWLDSEENAAEFREKINQIINGIGNLIIINGPENSTISDKHPKDKNYSITEGSYKLDERWANPKEWKSLITARGENIYKFMEKYFSVEP